MGMSLADPGGVSPMRTSLRRSPPHANQQNASGRPSHKRDPAAKWISSEIPLRGGRRSRRTEEPHARALYCSNKKVCRGRCSTPRFQYEPLLDKWVTAVSVVYVPRVRITQLSPCRPHLEEKAKKMT